MPPPEPAGAARPTTVLNRLQRLSRSAGAQRRPRPVSVLHRDGGL